MNKKFMSYTDAIQYAKVKRLEGFSAYVAEQESYYNVLVWKV